MEKSELNKEREKLIDFANWYFKNGGGKTFIDTDVDEYLNLKSINYAQSGSRTISDNEPQEKVCNASYKCLYHYRPNEEKCKHCTLYY